MRRDTLRQLPRATQILRFLQENCHDVEQKIAQIRRHLEAAVRLQRKSWDEALAIQELTTNYDRDFYAPVAELAGGFKDNEAMTADVINSLLAPQTVIYPESALVQ